MDPTLLMVMPAKLIRIKAELRFQARNPWNGNRPETFAVDTYGYTLASIKTVLPDVKEPMWQGGFYRALRSESDGATRFLPDSLIELWRQKTVPTEALPELLHHLAPSLRKSDLRPMLRNPKMKVGLALEIFFCLGLFAIAVVGVVLGELPLWTAIAVVLATAAVCWLFLYLLFFAKLFRRKRQMRFIREQLPASS